MNFNLSDNELVKSLDMTCKDKAYWKPIFLKAKANNRFRLIKTIKWFRYEIRRPKPIPLEKLFTKEIINWALATLDKISKDSPCVDNFRFAIKGNRRLVKRYKKIKADGCCGEYDTKKEGPDGKIYMLGYNYGH